MKQELAGFITFNIKCQMRYGKIEKNRPNRHANIHRMTEMNGTERDKNNI